MRATVSFIDSNLIGSKEERIGEVMHTVHFSWTPTALVVSSKVAQFAVHLSEAPFWSTVLKHPNSSTSAPTVVVHFEM